MPKLWTEVIGLSPGGPRGTETDQRLSDLTHSGASGSVQLLYPGHLDTSIIVATSLHSNRGMQQRVTVKRYWEILTKSTELPSQHLGSREPLVN